MLKTTSLIAPLVFALSFFLQSCGSSSNKNALDSGSIATDGMNLEINGDSDSGKAGALKTVYFDFNSAVIGSTTKDTLTQNAIFLKENAAVEVQVEGHCDERGGIQFNLALGEKRANVVKDFLIASGIEAKRITTISFGKERPLAFGHEEESWTKNRRGNFVITAK